jgi:hypothetical protein
MGPKHIGQLWLGRLTQRMYSHAAVRPRYRVPVSACGVCASDLLFCDRHDVYFCPVCDRWQERAPAQTPSAPTADDRQSPASRYYRFPRPNMRPNRSAIDLGGLMSTKVDPSGSGRLAACSAESVVQTQVV